MIMVSSDMVPGMDIKKSLGIVKGSSVLTADIGRDFMAGLKALAGGEIIQYKELIDSSRMRAEEEMVRRAVDLGADAIIGIRYVSSSVMAGASEVLVYGTAVKAEIAGGRNS
jgi:uncharacterized protein YbjQ (UPF0145 family)